VTLDHDDERRHWLAALGALVAGACSKSSPDAPPAASAAGTGAQDAARIAPYAYRVVLENDHVRVLEFLSRPGMGMCGIGRHSHPPHLTIALSDAAVRVTLEDGRAIVATNRLGDVMWSEAETHTTENVGSEGARALIVEIKSLGAARGAV
jgi:hypothetical protein